MNDGHENLDKNTLRFEERTSKKQKKTLTTYLEHVLELTTC